MKVMEGNMLYSKSSYLNVTELSCHLKLEGAGDTSQAVISLNLKKNFKNVIGYKKYFLEFL